MKDPVRNEALSCATNDGSELLNRKKKKKKTNHAQNKFKNNSVRILVTSHLRHNFMFRASADLLTK